MIARHDKLTVAGILLVAVLMFALTVFAFPAKAAPYAASAEECAAYADMALTAHALARQGIKRDTADAAMAEIYSGAAGERIQKIMRLIVRAAYRDDAKDITPSDFGTLVGRICLGSRGNMDAVLGSDV